MAKPNVKSVFDEECKHLAIDQKLVKAIHAYQVGFVNKNEQHVEFFGGNLLGVQVVRFVDDDRAAWFEDVLDADEVALEQKLHALENINPEFNVSSDVMNLSCAWLINALYNSPKLSASQKHEAMVDVLLVMQYKFLTSRLYRHFQFPAQKEVAEATYASLSYKFDIKQYGSWAKLLRAKAEDAIDPRKGLHFKTVVSKMDDDLDVVYFVNDTQGRIRDMLKNLYNEYLKVYNQGQRITAASAVVEHDGAEILRDKTKNLSAYTRYLNSVITDKNSFIRDELVKVVERIMHRMPPAAFHDTLEWMSTNYRQARAGEVEEILNEVLIHAFDYLSTNRSVTRAASDLPQLVSKLRGVYQSSRSTDPTLIALREKTEKIVVMATGRKPKDSAVPAVRTGVLLYCVLRAFTMRHYASAQNLAVTGVV